MTNSSADIFDSLSVDYDDVFSNSNIGKAQRKRVWEHLEDCLASAEISRVLELNCGTGVDARWFSSKGCEVLATDVSPEMLKVAKSNSPKGITINYKEMDLRDLHTLEEKGFDLVFSNFGGLNCVSRSELKNALSSCSEILNPGGALLTVVMPRFCLWESAYYASKRNLTKAVRRWSRSGDSFTVNGQSTNIYYYSPREMTELAMPHFECTYVKPIGALIPPSYCEKTFLGRSRVVNSLAWLESKLPHSSVTAAVADHFLIEFRKRR